MLLVGEEKPHGGYFSPGCNLSLPLPHSSLFEAKVPLCGVNRFSSKWEFLMSSRLNVTFEIYGFYIMSTAAVYKDYSNFRV